ncbi:MAG: SDR family oxidoreductase [Hyphomicrobiaceae bacterium]
MEIQRTPKAALVTGASRRIGRAIALNLGRHGWDVAVHYASGKSAADEVVAEITDMGQRAVAVACDLARVEAGAELIAACGQKIGALTCLVNNASTFIDDEISNLQADVWDKQLAVNLRAPVFLAQAFARQLPDGCSGNIVNVIDQRVLQPLPGLFSYALAKEGLFAATKLLAQALAPNIRVNGVGPGPVLRSVLQTEAAFEAEVKSTLLGLAVPPEEIAHAVQFILASPSLTGQMIAIDAGQHLSRTYVG